MTKQEEIVKELLSRIRDETGAVRRYAESLKGKGKWQLEKR